MSNAADPGVELVSFIAKAIVTTPDEVRVSRGADDVIELRTAQRDRGRVIGRQGRVAKALRAVIQASGAAPTARLDILD